MSRDSESRRDTLAGELDAVLTSQGASPRPAGGDRLFPAVVAGVSGSDVILELGPRVQGMIPLAEFDEAPAPGAELRVTVTGQEDGLWIVSLKEARALAAWNDMEIGSLVKATVVGMNKGGLELKIGKIEAFMPASQIAMQHVEDLAAFGGETFVCEVLEIDPAKKRIVVSRRAVLEEERRDAHKEAVETLAEGAVLRGKVSRLESYGAFVQILGGIEGLLHVSNISHTRIGHPEEVLKSGQEVEVQVLEIKEGGRRIGLGMKQLLPNPWDDIAERLHEDSILTGTVRRVADFGAFIEVEPGVDGLLHVSEIDSGRVQRVRDLVREGEELAVRVLSIDPYARRISLSRLDARGALLGSDEAAAATEIDSVIEEGQAVGPIGTNLGSLFKKALSAKKLAEENRK
jgi:ribosomal protein S1